MWATTTSTLTVGFRPYWMDPHYYRPFQSSLLRTLPILSMHGAWHFAAPPFSCYHRPRSPDMTLQVISFNRLQARPPDMALRVPCKFGATEPAAVVLPSCPPCAKAWALVRAVRAQQDWYGLYKLNRTGTGCMSSTGLVRAVRAQQDRYGLHDLSRTGRPADILQFLRLLIGRLPCCYR